jgi:gluconolactonase
MTTKIEIIAAGLNFPEGPAFAPDGELWCVELRGGNLTRVKADGLDRYPTGGNPNGLAIDYRGIAWFCDSEQNAIRIFDPATEQFETAVDSIYGDPLFKPNDLAFDAAGNLVFTCPGDSRQEPTGYVCCLRPDGALTKITTEKYFPNGLAFSADGNELVIAETYRHRLWKGRWDAVSAVWIDPQPWADVGEPPGPDGMASGADGLVYVAVYRHGQIKCVEASGQIVRLFDLPGKNPTNCAFDPAGRLGLVVTEAEQGLLLSLPELGPGVRLFDGK